MREQLYLELRCVLFFCFFQFDELKQKYRGFNEATREASITDRIFRKHIKALVHRYITNAAGVNSVFAFLCTIKHYDITVLI